MNPKNACVKNAQTFFFMLIHQKKSGFIKMNMNPLSTF